MKKFWRIPVYFCIALVAWTALAWALANYLVVEKLLAKADAILVLGGSAAYIERTQKAALIFKQGTAPKIFLTNDGVKGGWDQKEQRNPYFAERAREELIQQGVPKEAIEILPTVVRGTDDEANLVVQVAAERKLKSILLVTSAYHTRRAFWVFGEAMRDNNTSVEIGIESPPAGQQTPTAFIWWLSPRGWDFVAGEYIKSAYYWIK